MNVEDAKAFVRGTDDLDDLYDLMHRVHERIEELQRYSFPNAVREAIESTVAEAGKSRTLVKATFDDHDEYEDGTYFTPAATIFYADGTNARAELTGLEDALADMSNVVRRDLGDLKDWHTLTVTFPDRQVSYP